jgi:UDP-N-acetylglucosamine 2-epimerase
MSSRRCILSIVGARPQFIKLAPLADRLVRDFDHLLLHTGQHYDLNMSDIFFDQLRLPQPDFHLGIGGGSHGGMTGRMLGRIEKILLQRRPDMVLVYGDTNSTLAGALAAAKLGIPVAHAEAGMRSFVADMPEEINRRLTDHISTLLLAPTNAAVRNLRDESVPGRVVRSGDVMYELLESVKPLLKPHSDVLRQTGLKPQGFALVTVHRAANVDARENLEQLIEVLGSVDMPVLFPIHPRTSARLKKFRLDRRLAGQSHVTVIEPLGYLDLLSLASDSKVVLTDSGGLQKEALFLGTPVLTLREETEWVETLRRGNRLVGLDPKRVARAFERTVKVRPPSSRYQGKQPTEHIANAIKRYFREN